MDEASAELMSRYAAGDDDAATEIFERYVDRLTRLARSRLSVRLAQRFDADDVIQSAFRSFFVGAQRGQFTLRRGGDLWRLLVAITMRKLYRGVGRHTATKRSVDAEASKGECFNLSEQAIATAPTAEDAAALAEEMELVMSELDAFGRRVFELRLQGEQIAEIAGDTARSERSVRRMLATIRQLLAVRLGNGDE
jgi:RNA polymerase sigma-70 factor (ECF subfamily)